MGRVYLSKVSGWCGACLSWATTYIRQSELGRFASRLDTAHAVIMAVPQCGETDAQEITIDLLGEDKL